MYLEIILILNKNNQNVRAIDIVRFTGYSKPSINPNSLRDLHIPSLVIVGTKDIIKDAHSQLIADSIQSCSIVRIAGDHFIAANNSKTFNETVLKFLLED